MLPNQTGFEVTMSNQYGRQLGYAVDVDCVEATKRAREQALKEISTANIGWNWHIASIKTLPYYKEIK